MTYRQYLLGRKFLLRSDHAALQWLRRTPQLIGQQARWLSIVEEYDFEILHRPGTAHNNADAMSRIASRVYAIREAVLRPVAAPNLPRDWDRSSIVREQQDDSDLQWIIRWKAEQEQEPSVDEVRPKSAVVKTLVAQWPQLRVIDGLLVREWLHADGSCPRWLQLIPPPERRNDLIRLSHEGMTGGHMGLRRTMKQLQQRAYWPGWTDSVRQYLRRCSACARYLRGKPPRQGLLQDMSVGESRSRPYRTSSSLHQRLPVHRHYN